MADFKSEPPADFILEKVAGFERNTWPTSNRNRWPTSVGIRKLRVLHGNGGFATWLAGLARTDVLILDDWALAPLEPAARADLLEIVDDRAGTRATILTTQLPVEHWHSWIGDPTIADAILDRLLAQQHRITLKGESLRRSATASTTPKGPPKTDN